MELGAVLLGEETAQLPPHTAEAARDDVLAALLIPAGTPAGSRGAGESARSVRTPER
ncbi:hypothetical protein SMICM304S_05839 [Streptomyces microflavus]